MCDTKQLLLLSDTHSYLDPTIKSYGISADEIWHAGDIGNLEVLQTLENWNDNAKAVYGNIDNHEIRRCCPLHQFYAYGEHRILMIHIAGSIGRYNQVTRQLISELQPTILICGHSHILKVMKDPAFDLLHINPGAAGHHGFHKVRTIIRFELTKHKMSNLEVIELGKRGR